MFIINYIYFILEDCDSNVNLIKSLDLFIKYINNFNLLCKDYVKIIHINQFDKIPILEKNSFYIHIRMMENCYFNILELKNIIYKLLFFDFNDDNIDDIIYPIIIAKKENNKCHLINSVTYETYNKIYNIDDYIHQSSNEDVYYLLINQLYFKKYNCDNIKRLHFISFHHLLVDIK